MFSRASRRKIKKLTPAVDRALDSDRRFFDQHPSRSYRLRPAFPPEVEVLAVLNEPKQIDLPPNWIWFVAVRQILPGVRVRAFGAMAPRGGDDPPEAECRAFYLAWTASTRAFEARFAALASREYGP
jgi:hypothetical protein